MIWKNGERFLCKGAIIHEDYDNHDNSPDLALLLLEEERVPGSVATLLPREFIEDLRVGQPLGVLGFPWTIRNYAHDTGLHLPLFKDGVLSALRPFTGSWSEINTEMSLRTNLDLLGG